MMNLRSLVLGFATVLATLPAAAENQAPDRLQIILDRGVLRVGTTMDTPVFSMRDAATGKLHGLDMDVLETLNTSQPSTAPSSIAIGRFQSMRMPSRTSDRADGTTMPERAACCCSRG